MNEELKRINEMKDDWVISNILAKHAEETPDAPAIQWMNETPVTYKELYDQSLRFAGFLQKVGVKKGDTVLIMQPNSLEIIYSWLSTNLLGGIEVPINVHYKGTFLAHEANDCKAKVAIIDAEYLERFLEIKDDLKYIEEIIIVGENATIDSVSGWNLYKWDEVFNSEEPITPVKLYHYDTAAIMYTSGTTGLSKGVVIPYGLTGIFAHAIITVGKLTRDDVYYVCLPLFHANAQFMQVLPGLVLGIKVSIWPRFSATQWLDQIREVGATVSNTLGVMCEFIYRQPQKDNDADNPLKVLFAIPTPEDIAEDFEKRFGVTCLEGYGMTETSVFTYRRMDEPLRPGSAGRPLDYMEVRIVDPVTDEELPRNEIGEIVVRPRIPGIFMQGYHGTPEKTIEAWRNLWFHTGDAGKMDEDGYLYFADRIKDAIRRRGENISSVQIEMVLNAHPAIKESAAIAVSASEYGAAAEDEVMVYIVLKENCEIDYVELHEYCKNNMPYFAVPRYFEVISELPKTPNEKIRKVALRERGITENTWDREKAGVVLK